MLQSNWLESRSFHVRADLSWHFLEDFFGKVTSSQRLIELYELDNITGNGLTLRIPQWTIVAIKLFHSFEVSAAYTHDDD